MKKVSLFFFATAFILILGFFWWDSQLKQVDSNDTVTKIFTIRPGEGLHEIANDLQRNGLIKNSLVFYIMVKQQGLDHKIQAGDFRLSSASTAEQIANNLTVGTLDIWVTIPEGKRADEIADILKEKIPSYEDSWRDTLNTHEGYLFPDTYLFPRQATIDQILATLTDNFEKKYEGIPSNVNNTYTKSQIVTIASLIDREARLPEDRSLVASVIHNRLQDGMPLQIDATIQYALGFQTDGKTWWKQNLTLDDLKIDSPFNSYTNPGLPPTPISNPGLEALTAAIHPANTNYLFYLSDKSGHNHYAVTEEQHNENIKKYGL